MRARAGQAQREHKDKVPLRRIDAYKKDVEVLENATELPGLEEEMAGMVAKRG